ncbi:c2h2 finger domain-containing protein [Ophiostoma piceae UAMH 11346]|uniref:C2h2 finger domain-containing protein n=1 Tax=Ophiostoma piceae (strain UAMH 11346) TaxID=1262450 RepID=S3BZ71_OPHP1|nr:c2h2 finger domain-containing protein [Ophiostoma piceae UAMH 11346]
MTSYSYSDLSLDLTEHADDLDNQLPTTSSSLFFSPPHVAPPMSHHATSSPALNDASTPAESVLSIHYQSSDYSDLNDVDAGDQLFNEFFNSAGTASLVGGIAPTFLGQDADFDLFGPSDTLSTATANTHTYTTPEPTSTNFKPGYPISPDQTPSLNAPSSPDNQPGGASLAHSGFKFAPRDICTVAGFDGLVSPEQLTKSAPDTSGITPFPDLQAFVVNDINAQLTPDTTSSGGSLGNNDNGSLSTDGGATTTTAPPMSSLNPHVTVSLWGKDSAYHEDSYLSTSEIKTERADSADGRRGIDPANRSSTELATTANEDAEARKVEKQNIAVSNWLSTADASDPEPAGVAAGAEPRFEGVSNREIDLGGDTENIEQPGRTYFTGRGGEITETDYEIMLKSTAWDNSPSVLHISKGPTRHQPESSQAAIERFERMYRDNASIVSRAATWGTRRRSLPSIADIEGVTSGNFLKKLSISRDSHSRRPSILGNLRTLVRMPSTSQQNKRSRAAPDDDASSYFDGDSGAYSPDDQRRDSTKSTNTLGRLPRTNSWGKNKQPMPSINTALISMGSNMASIGATHTRNGSVSRPHAGSISLSPPLTSPKSPLLKVSNSIRRPRSKSDARGIPDNAHPNLIRMLKKTGGPPVASLATANATSTFPGSTPMPFGPTHASAGSTSGPAPIQIPATNVAVIDPDDEDDDEDEAYEDGDLKAESNELIDKISPDFAGFKELVLGLNPMLENVNTYLVDRIAHQQIVRYKGLLNSKIKHLGQVKGNACSNMSKCIGQGGGAILCDSKGKPRSLDPLSTTYDADDVDDISSPLDGAINSDSFPQYIPMPPTSTLPAEFECQLCFQIKCPKKPSDWTKHVHEDVQPFTCTWDRCRDPKMFKRKADWVRHENEGHRHLEWWMCNVEECRHTCYRRDNFLQHLVREHKFVEPKNKTKAAIKRAGAIDPTWQRVEQCRAETTKLPQDEACRFCSKTFPTWKKLTVHLAKHMEHISLPILRLVERKEVEPDTLISPVQDPPPRTFAPVSTFQPSGEALHGGLAGYSPNTMVQGQGAGFQQNMGQQMGYGQPGAQDPNSFMYPPVTQVQYQQQAYYSQQQFGATAGTIPSHMQSLDAAATMNVHAGFNSNQAYAGNLPVTTGGYLGTNTNQYITDPVGLDAASYSTFPTTNALGLQTPIVANQMHFDAHIDHSIGNAGEQFTPQGSITHGSVSPFGHSPHQPQGQFYGQ